MTRDENLDRLLAQSVAMQAIANVSMTLLMAALPGLLQANLITREQVGIIATQFDPILKSKADIPPDTLQVISSMQAVLTRLSQA